MGPNAHTRPQIDMRKHSIIRIHMLLPSEPPRLVSAYRQQRNIHIPQTLSDFTKMGTQSCVTGKEKLQLSHLNHKTTPQSLVLSTNASSRPMHSGCCSYQCLTLLSRFPPIQFNHMSNSMFRQKT